MRKIRSRNVWLALYLAAFLGQGTAFAAKFQAVGNTDENHRATPNKQGEAVVTFDNLPTKMSFCLPGHIKMFTENGIPYMNGATETYIPSEGFHEGASYEPWNDTENKYSRMWIESQSDARIVVRHRCALIKGDKICHQEEKRVAPYGPGNWTDEWYVFHPDGTYVRRIKIWTAVARDSGSHFSGKKWPYELEGMYLWWIGEKPHGDTVSDHVEDEMITLIRMNGEHKSFNMKPYPLEVNQHDRMNEIYGDFRDANIHVINTKSKYRPWRMGRPSQGLLMSPYVPVHPMTQLVPSFPEGSGRRKPYMMAGLGQMNYRDFWKLEDDSFSEVWLNGWTNSKDPVDELVAIAHSWQEAPKMVSDDGDGITLHGYDIGERAYLLEASSSQGARLKIAASSESPIVNPMFLVNGWGADKPRLTIDGKEIPKSGDFRFGHYKTLVLQDGRKWENVLAVWAKINATKETAFTIRSANRP